MRVKVCGVRSLADLAVAVHAGADAVGFICGATHNTDDAVLPERLRTLVRHARSLSPEVERVLVTHLDDGKRILELADYAGVDAIQLHGKLVPGAIRTVWSAARGRRIIRAVHVTGEKAIDGALAVADLCHAVVLDTRTRHRLGGTGLTHDWKISARIVNALELTPCRVFLAGGLNPVNVAEAISVVRPFGVDVNSGVDDANGAKDREKCRQFVSVAHGSDAKQISGTSLQGALAR